ncbi:MAG: thiol-disulfide oxidoreductase DCC family protein [Candidatus Dormibacteraceae bacterium]
MARWVRRRDRAGRVLAIANQKRGVLARYGITREEADRAAWVIGPDGVWSEGAAAVNRVWREVGGGWSVLARAYRLWPLGAVEDAVYRWFARNRPLFRRFGVRPECEDAGADCE